MVIGYHNHSSQLELFYVRGCEMSMQVVQFLLFIFIFYKLYSFSAKISQPARGGRLIHQQRNQ